MNRIWEKMENEPQEWFDKFQLYLGQLKHKRTIEKTIALYYEKINENYVKDKHNWRWQVRKYSWLERAKAFDNAEHLLKLEAQQIAHIEEIKELEANRKLIGHAYTKGGVQLVNKCMDRIETITLKDITLDNLPQLLKTSVLMVDIGLTSLADALGLSEVIKATGVKKVKESLQSELKEGISQMKVVPINKKLGGE